VAGQVILKVTSQKGETMACQDNYTLPAEIVEQLNAQGWDYLPELVKEIINMAMKIEQQNFVGVETNQHSPRRNGHSNGYKLKTAKNACRGDHLCCSAGEKRGILP
jgi:hypothetical protein